MNNTINENYQLNSILDIYEGNSNQNTNTALDYYINHNVIPNGIVFSDKISPVGGMHAITNTYYYEKNNEFANSEFTPLLAYSYFKLDSNSRNFYKLISAKDIDFENAYLKYATQIHGYKEPIEYYELNYVEGNNSITKEEKSESSYIFNREITSHINNSYDLLNVVDYLLNRVNALNFLMRMIKEQKVVTNKIK